MQESLISKILELRNEAMQNKDHYLAVAEGRTEDPQLDVHEAWRCYHYWVEKYALYTNQFKALSTGKVA